jgi:hypothetical protein
MSDTSSVQSGNYTIVSPASGGQVFAPLPAPSPETPANASDYDVTAAAPPPPTPPAAPPATSAPPGNWQQANYAPWWGGEGNGYAGGDQSQPGSPLDRMTAPPAQGSGPYPQTQSMGPFGSGEDVYVTVPVDKVIVSKDGAAGISGNYQPAASQRSTKGGPRNARLGILTKQGGKNPGMTQPPNVAASPPPFGRAQQ